MAVTGFQGSASGSWTSAGDNNSGASQQSGSSWDIDFTVTYFEVFLDGSVRVDFEVDVFGSPTATNFENVNFYFRTADDNGDPSGADFTHSLIDYGISGAPSEATTYSITIPASDDFDWRAGFYFRKTNSTTYNSEAFSIDVTTNGNDELTQFGTAHNPNTWIEGGPDGTSGGDQVDEQISLTVTCFARGTLLLTDGGYRPVEGLKTGDMVQTLDRGLQPIYWIGSVRCSQAELVANPNLRPVQIRAGALGQGLPRQDLRVSPQHRVLVKSPIAFRMFGSEEVLAGAKHLLPVHGFEIAQTVTEVEYFHILLPRHEVVFAQGAPLETLYLGAQSHKSPCFPNRCELDRLFPDLQQASAALTPARVLPKGRLLRKLAERHAKNDKPLLGAGISGIARGPERLAKQRAEPKEALRTSLGFQHQAAQIDLHCSFHAAHSRARAHRGAPGVVQETGPLLSLSP